MPTDGEGFPDRESDYADLSGDFPEEFADEVGDAAEGIALAEDEPDSPGKDEAAILPWAARLREAARASELRPSQYGPFLAAVELDESRPPARRLGYRALFEAYCGQGKAHWLDPARALKPLTGILERFGGPVHHLRFVIVQALGLARSGISPDAFIRHVVLPRMRTDADWRHWRARHSVAISAIAELMAEARRERPFDGLHLGGTDVLSDVALAKYVGRPLCRLSEEQLSSLGSELEAYRSAWLGLEFGSRRFLLFLRQTVLPFLYRLSGLIDVQQLVPIIAGAASLERPFSLRLDALPARLAERVLNRSRLYDDLDRAIEAGRDGGSSWYSFAKQLGGYLTVVSALVSTNSGMTLIPRIAAILKRERDPGFSGACAEMIGLIRDSGGTAALSWHIERLASMESGRRPDFIREIRDSGGLSLDYPFREAFIPFDAEDGERIETAVRLCGELGILDRARSIMAERKRKELSLAIAFEAYESSGRDRREAAERFLGDAARGAERGWGQQDIELFDSDGAAGHELLMRRLIKGLGTGFSPMALKTRDLSLLLRLYGGVNGQSLPAISFEFRLAEGSDSDESRLSSLARDELRKRVGLDFIGKAVDALQAFEPESRAEEAFENECFAALGKMQRDVRKGLEPLQDKLAKLDADLAELRSEGRADDAEALDGRNAKLRQSALAAGRRLGMFDRLFALKSDETRSADQRFAAALHACAFVSKPGDPAAAACLSWALKRCIGVQGLLGRVDFIRADVSRDFVGLEQLTYLIDSLDILCKAVSQDAAVLSAIAPIKDPELSSFLEETSQLSGRGASAESLDAALRRISGASRLDAERTKWKELVDLSHKSKRDARNYSVRLSKCPLDAYFGDYGGICLSSMPDLILRPGFYPVRLFDEGERQIVGVALAAYCVNPRPVLGAKRYWLAFAFNPLRSLSRRWNARQMLIVYLAWRRALETLSRGSLMPVFLAGVGSSGIVSNNQAFQNLILNYERAPGPPETGDARGFQAIYPESQFARALQIVRPDDPSSFRSAVELDGLLAGELSRSGPA